MVTSRHAIPATVRGRMDTRAVLGAAGTGATAVPVTTWTGGTPSTTNAAVASGANPPTIRDDVAGTGRRCLQFAAASTQALVVPEWTTLASNVQRVDLLALVVPTAGDTANVTREIVHFSTGNNGGVPRAALRLIQVDWRTGGAGRRTDADASTPNRAGPSGTGGGAGLPQTSAVTLNYGAATVTSFKNGTQVDTGAFGGAGATSATASTIVTVGRQGTSAVNYLTGHLLDLWVLIGASDADRAVVQSIMQDETPGVTVAGYVPPPVIGASLPHTDPALSFTPAWTASADGRYTYAPGASVSFAFTGREFAVHGVRDVNGGEFAVYVDGARIATASQAAATRSTDALTYQSPMLAQGQHTVRLVALSGTVTVSRVIVADTPVTPAPASLTGPDRLVNIAGVDTPVWLHL